MRPRVNMITLAVADLQRSIQFYREGLGLPPEIFQEGEGHVAIEMQSGFYIVLMAREEIAKLANQEPAAQRSHEVVLSHPAGSPQDVDELLAQAAAAGATIPSKPEEYPWGYTGYFMDPDGHLWEVLGDPDFAEDN